MYPLRAISINSTLLWGFHPSLTCRCLFKCSIKMSLFFYYCRGTVRYREFALIKALTPIRQRPFYLEQVRETTPVCICRKSHRKVAVLLAPTYLTKSWRRKGIYMSLFECKMQSFVEKWEWFLISIKDKFFTRYPNSMRRIGSESGSRQNM